jgi:hypothetical protein
MMALGRRLTALIAAYTLALNALLAPFAVPPLAAATAWVICSSADHAQRPIDDKRPIDHQPVCPLGGACSALCCGAIGSLGAMGGHEALLSPGAGRRIDVRRWNDATIAPDTFRPQLARAPPAA